MKMIQVFDHVIFDTAPTGHTLRLLTLPSAWSGFMEQNTTGTSCLGPLAGWQAQQQLYQDTMHSLSDAAITTLVLVTRSEVTALREAGRTSGEFAELGVQNHHRVVNGVFQASDRSDRLAVAKQQRGETGLTFAGLTDTCAMGMLLARMPWNQCGPPTSTCCNT